MFQKVEKSYSEVFYYCIQEAVYWKLKAEIYNNSEQDKKRIHDPTKSSSCNIHSENNVTKYVYIPTDKKNIDPDNFDLELTKVGLGARSGVDNVMLVVKAIGECKEQNTLDMISKLSHYGGEFKDRGMVMVTEESKLIDDDQAEDFPETEEKYFKNEARSDEFSEIFKILANENRVFSFDKKRVDETRRRSQIGEFFNQERENKRRIDNLRKIQNSSKIVQRATEGVKYTSKLTQTGMNVYRNMHTASKGVDIQVDKRTIDQVVINQVSEARGNVDKLKIEEAHYVEERRKIETVRRNDIQVERQRVEHTEANRRLEEEQRRNFEIEVEKRRLEQAERDRRREEEREREQEREKIERDRNLRIKIDLRSKQLEQIRLNGEAGLRDIKEWLDKGTYSNASSYLVVKRKYEQLVNTRMGPLSDDDDDLERKLRRLNALMIEVETWNMNINAIHRQLGRPYWMFFLRFNF